MIKRLILTLAFCFASSAWAATGDIVAARIVGATTTVSDATSACNTSGACNGWVLELDETVLAWTSVGEAYSLGIGSNGSVSSAKIVVTVTSTGYKADGTSTTYTRTLYATHQLRKVYNVAYTPPYPNDETNVTTTLTMRFALGAAPKSVGDVPESGYVFTGDTSVSVNVAAGIYTYSSTPSNAATGLSVTNSSTLAFPKAIANWSRPGWQRITGSTLTVAAVGFAQGAHDGRPLAAMIFSAADAHSHTATTTVTLPTIDFSQGDAVPVQEYIGTLNLSGFTQADLVTVNFKAVPWLGVTASIMDTSDGTYSQPTPLYAPIYFINDAAGTFGTAAAVVDGSAGNDSTCVAVSEATFNANPNSNAANTSPCLTANKAIQIIMAWNNSNASPARKDQAGSIWMKAGSYLWTGTTTSVAASTGTNKNVVWLNVQPFPGVARSSVVLTGITDTASNYTGDSPFHVKGLTVNITSGSPVELFHGQGNNSNYLWVDGCSLTMTSGSIVAYSFSSDYWTQNTAVNLTATAFSPYTAAHDLPPLLRGNVFTGYTQTLGDWYTTIGNLFAPSSPAAMGFSVYESSGTLSVQPIFAFNVSANNNYTTNSQLFLFNTLSTALGAAVVGNLFEFNSATSQSMVGVARDSSTSTLVPNVMLWGNTLTGQRINRNYNETGSSPLYRYLWQEVGQLYESTAIKSDTFSTANAGRVGNWAGEYSVGYWGDFDAETGTVSNPVGVANQFQAEFNGIQNAFRIPNSNAQQSGEPPSNSALMTAVGYVNYVSRASWDGTSVGAGNGNYRLKSNSPAAHMMTNCVLPYDLDGQVRNCSGWGSAGAYEQARLLTGVTAF